MNGTITWLPIENAPKDDQNILLAEPHPTEKSLFRIHYGQWVNHRGLFYLFDGQTEADPTDFAFFAYINAPEA